MSDENYSVDVLVNDKPIRKYAFDNKLFIEAKLNTEYSIRIKNNSSGRILAITSIDGLDALSGKKATVDSNGYVVNGYNSLTIDGFRISDDKVAKFVFDYKDTSYAASKEDGSEKNVGVIGVRLFAEKDKLKEKILEIHHHHWKQRRYGWPYDSGYDSGTPLEPCPSPNWPQWPQSPIIWCENTSATFGGNDVTYGTSTTDHTLGDSGATKGGKMMGSSKGNPSGVLRSMNMMSNNTPKLQNCSQELSSDKSRGFDMGTKWGEAKESRVVEVEFEKGILALTKNIYYASRESLIQMGVPLGNEKQVSFPEPFAEKYATPPKGWKG